MDEYIKRDAAIAIIEEKQKELCPVGRCGRGYVYGSDREKYDAWDEIIDALENVPAADVASVVHGRWDDSGRYTFPSGNTAVRCTNCDCALTESEYRLYEWNYCPICGAKMDGGTDHAPD
mgnify:CR=1 FL=1